MVRAFHSWAREGDDCLVSMPTRYPFEHGRPKRETAPNRGVFAETPGRQKSRWRTKRAALRNGPTTARASFSGCNTR